MEYKEILSTRNYKAGYKVITGIFDDSDYGGDGNLKLSHAETHDGKYLGNSKTAHFLCKKKGIKPEFKREDSTICSIGFSDSDKKWYGWSHRAINGFSIGDKVKKGDCAFVPKNLIEAKEAAISFYCDSLERINVVASEKTHLDENNVECFKLSWDYTDKYKETRNNLITSMDVQVGKFGRGEWTAKNTNDTKQMAIDFADGVS